MSEETEEIKDATGDAGAEQSSQAPAESVTPAEVVANATATEKARGRRLEKIGIVTSDKMQKTVVVRVDRLVKHPVYKRYVRRRTKFMAHNEVEGVTTGDQVRIVETRPLSARKRWRVVEVLRKAAK
jgi:small subunit ribosomal protein S17